MLFAVCFAVCVFLFCFAFVAISHVIVPGIQANKKYPLKMEAVGTCKPEEQFLSYLLDHLGP